MKMLKLILAGFAVSTSAIAMGQTAPEHSPEATNHVGDLVDKMTLDEKIGIVTGVFGTVLPPFVTSTPPSARGGDGFAPGVPRLGIPDLNLVGAGVGVTDLGKRKNGQATSLPSSLAVASSFDLELAYDYGAVIGEETRRKGFNISLGGGVNLARDPRGGRAFEYYGEDPVLAGRSVAATLRGTEDQGVVGTIKHFALNDVENGRFGIDVKMDERAMREAELLAFEIGIKESGVGAVMCSYNLVNGVYACENPYLLNEVLKKEWGFKGWVMSDWGATHSTAQAANAGLDQEFWQSYYGAPLKTAVEKGEVSKARLDDMTFRIVSQLDRVGAIMRNEPLRAIDEAKGAAVALRTAEQGSVLLKNDGVLPLDRALGRTIAVIGFNADRGVISGGGSGQVNPIGGNAVLAVTPPDDPSMAWRNPVWANSAPLAAIRAKAPSANVTWDPGNDPAAAARAASSADVAIVFAGRHRSESLDVPDLKLGNGQDELIAAVAKANPRTIVVLETGGAQLMPWIDQVKGVLAVWYPGQKGGEAIANLLFGSVNPSGKLPLSFPLSEADLPRPKLPGPPVEKLAGMTDGQKPIRSSVTYAEGALIGYKWYDASDKTVLFPFGHGLSYTTFAYSGVAVTAGDPLTVSFEISNSGKRDGTEIAQVYVAVPGSGVPRRLAGWARATLTPGCQKRVTAKLEPKALANWDVVRKRWVMPAGEYVVSVGASSKDLKLSTILTIDRERLLP